MLCVVMYGCVFVSFLFLHRIVMVTLCIFVVSLCASALARVSVLCDVVMHVVVLLML